MLKPVLALAAGLALSFTALAAQAAEVLKVSAIPDEAPTELLRKFKPLGEYLEKELGMKVEFVPVADYPAVVEALATDRLDLAWLGGFTFVQVRLKTGNAIPLVQREQDAQFTSKFITANPDVQVAGRPQGQDLRLRLGVLHLRQPDAALLHAAGRHQARKPSSAASATPVRMTPPPPGSRPARSTAGVLNASVWDKLVAAGKVDTNKVKVFATTPAYYDYNWTVRGTLDPALTAKIKQAFLALDPANPEHKAILDLQAASRFIDTKPENYKGIEDAARAADLLK